MMPAHSPHEQREISHNQFRDHTVIHQGNVQGNVYYGAPHLAARAEVVRVIPYPRNEDLVHRRDLIDKLDTLLPPTPGSRSAALWGLGGSGRDAHIAGTLVGARRGIELKVMAMDEATTLLARIRDEPLTAEEASGGTGVDALLQELQCLPLAISQAGAYMRRMSMTAGEYLGLLRQGKTRWEVLKVSDTDRHRRPEVSNSVLETWRISTEQIREESEMSYRILHVIAYVDSQDIPQELVDTAACQYDVDDEVSTKQVSELEILEAVRRLKEFSFLSLRQVGNGRRSYEMHKLVQEAMRYGLRISSLAETALDRALEADNGPNEVEAFYSGRALQIVDGLFPSSEPASWARCEQYLTHAVRVGEWAEVSGTEIKTATLLGRVSEFLNDQGRWREMEPMHKRAWKLRQMALGEKHPDTTRSMADIAETYHAQGRYNEAQEILTKVLELRREVLGEKHPDTIRSMADLGMTYHAQGRYDEDEEISTKVLELRREVLGEKHPDTISSMASLVATYHAQGRYDEAEKLDDEVVSLQYKELEKNRRVNPSMANHAKTYNAQGRYDKDKEISVKVLELQQEELGEKHLDTIRSMAELAETYHAQGRYNEAQEILTKVLELRREVLGEKHPDTISSMADIAETYHAQGRYDEDEEISTKVLELQREVLGEQHPDTISSMADLGMTYHAQGRYDEAEGICQEALDLRREVLGEKHPDTISSMADLGMTYHAQDRYVEDEEISAKALELRREVLGEKHPDTIRSMADLGMTYYAQGRYAEAETLKARVGTTTSTPLWGQVEWMYEF
ncbi:hypothetical protein BFJ63_vAg17428 [Fusarium oxysporum f. sp. narcissi]|uniref:Uncharacterized protein n=1 Tax=Fusarium oxysporum f. sp. narcissi TaxID=451672 RepID=A0A4Q2V4Y6_FUSOX|nr:hypothetical protein BFJ63_vAg17428 [Fusarium oxysporum f. sp. narcissi]